MIAGRDRGRVEIRMVGPGGNFLSLEHTI